MYKVSGVETVTTALVEWSVPLEYMYEALVVLLVADASFVSREKPAIK